MELRTPQKSDIRMFKINYNGANQNWTYHLLVDCFDRDGTSVLIPLPEHDGHEAHQFHLGATVGEIPLLDDLISAVRATLQSQGHTLV